MNNGGSVSQLFGSLLDILRWMGSKISQRNRQIKEDSVYYAILGDKGESAWRDTDVCGVGAMRKNCLR